MLLPLFCPTLWNSLLMTVDDPSLTLTLEDSAIRQRQSTIIACFKLYDYFVNTNVRNYLLTY